ncbi:MAG: hypothetical protein JWM57_2951 [Phycisphaerales bacterium]|nr:hypothetical protein [Phycisphaerales bacterium]
MPLRRLKTTLLIGLLAITGCELAKVKNSVVAEHGGSTDDAQMDFWHDLNDAKIACNDDAFHAILLYLDSKDEYTDYVARLNGMKSRGLLPTGFNAPANESVERGTVAVVLVKAMQIKGGLMMHVTGASPRYAVRELCFEGIYPPSTPNQTFSGSELVGIIGRVEDYQRGDAANKRAAELPSDATAAK